MARIDWIKPIGLLSLVLCGSFVATVIVVSVWVGDFRAGPFSILASPSAKLEGEVGGIVVAEFIIRNTDEEPIRVLGASSSCGCVVSEGLPMDLAPGDSGLLRFHVQVGEPDSTGYFRRSVHLFVNRDVYVPNLLVEIRVKSVS